jgi:long-chain fatty acid transport protein
MRTLIVALLLCPAAALAGGYAIPNPNPRELALAQATVAAQNGPEAILMNTAALAGQSGFQAAASLQYLDNRTSWSDPALGSASTRSHPNYPPALSVSWGAQLSNGMAYGLGVGAQVPAGGSLFWPTNWPGAQRIQDVDQRGYQLRAGGALEPFKGVKLGAAFGWWQVTEKLTQQINYVAFSAPATLGLSGGGAFFSLSTELRAPGIPLVLGVDYKSQTPVTLHGKAHFTDVPPSFQPPLIDQAATEKVTLPSELFLGLAYQATPNLQLMASWSLEGWHVYTGDTYVGDKGFVVSVPRNYRDATVWRFGAEYARLPALPALTLRAGLLRSISEQPKTTIDPSLSDADSWAPSIGAGYEVRPGLRVDLGYSYAFFDKVTASGPDAFPGSYKTTAHLLSLGVTWRQRP